MLAKFRIRHKYFWTAIFWNVRRSTHFKLKTVKVQLFNTDPLNLKVIRKTEKKREKGQGCVGMKAYPCSRNKFSNLIASYSKSRLNRALFASSTSFRLGLLPKDVTSFRGWCRILETHTVSIITSASLAFFGLEMKVYIVTILLIIFANI